ncbi:response regulator, partial [Escherichia coli]
VVSVGDGAAALDVLRGDDAPKMAVLDWMMPQLDGLDVCRRVRALYKAEPTYIIILTAKGGKQNIVTALD